MTREDVVQRLKDRAREAEEIIRRYLPAEEGFNRTVAEAMNYSVLAGGKRLRPILMREAFRLYDGTDEAALHPFMAAIEFIHTYSLVHDDLPAMDNDDYRRGKPTTHKKFGAGMATLAGDGLLNHAFETAFLAFDFRETDAGQADVVRALRILADKAGINGMIGGQCADLKAEKEESGVRTRDELIYIHKNKTAAMIESALMIGATLAGAAKEDVRKMEQAGEKIGLAFQIRDDILDVEGDASTLGKDIGSDAKNGKLTYVSMYGSAQAREDVEKLSEEAIRLTAGNGDERNFLQDLIEWMITREL
ncbi:MAG: polyprenyl synthetase family protein [Lachnospiraceae bacterium]|nr:polyprenyl synthetase family protein [Lachnospiraceae bacterium]